MVFRFHLTLQQMNLFITVAELKSISSAAERLRIAQPALSRQLRSMEEALGVQLLERHSWGVSTTHAGNLLVEHAQHILQLTSEAEIAISSAGTEVSGNVTLALPPTIERAIAASVSLEFRKLYPHVTLCIRSGYSGDVEEWLCNGDVDLGILYTSYSVRRDKATHNYDRYLLYASYSARRLRLTSLLVEELYLIGPPGNELTDEKFVPVSELVNLSLIVPGKAYGLRKHIEDIFARENVALNIAVEVEGLQTQIDLVMKGVGFTILPLVTVIDEVNDNKLTATRIVNPEFHRELVLATPADRATSPAVTRLTELLTHRVETMVSGGIWPGRIESAATLNQL